jgi:hypothetical protein
MTGTPPRDWDKELAEIDKLIGKSPPNAASAVPAVQGRSAGPRAAGTQPVAQAGKTPARSGSVAGAWFRVGLGVVLGAAITQWPYPNACGVGLFVYMGTLGVVMFTGGWAAVSTWRKRIGLAHIAATGVIFWGLALLVRVLLPRLGYASEQLPWFCQ